MIGNNLRGSHPKGEQKLGWSLLLAVLVGFCSLSAPHLLGHAHVHRNSNGSNSRLSGASQRSRNGAASAESEHEADQADSPTTRDPHTFDVAASLVAFVHATETPSGQWILLGLVTPQDAPLASDTSGSPHRGRAPPLS